MLAFLTFYITKKPVIKLRQHKSQNNLIIAPSPPSFLFLGKIGARGGADICIRAAYAGIIMVTAIPFYREMNIG